VADPGSLAFYHTHELEGSTMKTFLTKYEKDGKWVQGEPIEAESLEIATVLAERIGLKVAMEYVEIFTAGDPNTLGDWIRKLSMAGIDRELYMPHLRALKGEPDYLDPEQFEALAIRLLAEQKERGE
jgi:hypothetical protein